MKDRQCTETGERGIELGGCSKRSSALRRLADSSRVLTMLTDGGDRSGAHAAFDCRERRKRRRVDVRFKHGSKVRRSESRPSSKGEDFFATCTRS
jgi:hypothetical protein